MREATFADPLEKAIKRHEHALEQLKKVAHYSDGLGRSPTESELAEFFARVKSVGDALHAICAAPCADFKMLRRKVKILGVYLKTSSLIQDDQRALVESILQMPKGTAIDG